MKIKVSEAIGPVLDWMVAKALGHNLKVRNWKDLTDRLDPVEDADMIAFYRESKTVRVSAEQIPNGGWFPNPRYSTDWSQGGPIIEREGISWHCGNKTSWHAYGYGGHENFSGPTPLIAAMRCYVASKLGDEVEVPGELLK